MASLFPSLSSYNVSPAPQSGSGAYGSVPGAIGLPTSIYSQLNDITPNLSGMTNSTAGNIQNELSGKLSSGAIDQLQNQAATYGVSSGMPGAGLVGNDYIKSLGLTSEGLTQKGNSDYLNFLTGVGSTLTSPQTQLQVADQNAAMAAAPNPEQAAQQQEMNYYQSMLMQMGLAKGAGGGGGSSGGVGGGGGSFGGLPNNPLTPLNTYTSSGLPYAAGTMNYGQTYSNSGIVPSSGWLDGIAGPEAQAIAKGAQAQGDTFSNWTTSDYMTQ